MHSGDLGDHIGMESCVDLEIDNPSALSSAGGGGRSENRKRWGMSRCRSSSMSGKKAKELPPPLPIPTSTVMKRYYTDDGRLIITEEKVDSPKYYFTACRSHGRLTLQLVRSDSDADVVDKYSSSENEEENEIAEEEEEECSKVAVVGSGDGDGGSRGGGKCFPYHAAAVRAAVPGSCLFVNQNQLHAMRPVQI